MRALGGDGACRPPPPIPGLTRGDEAVEVPDEGTEAGPAAGLVVHTLRNERGQLRPLWCGELEVALVEIQLLGGGRRGCWGWL